MDNVGSRLIGLYDVTCSAGFSGLGMRIICATFHWVGKYLKRMIALIIIVTKRITLGGDSLRTFPFIPSYPGAF